MPQPRNRQHIPVLAAPRSEKYRPHPRKIDPTPIPSPPSREQHGQALLAALSAAEQLASQRRAGQPITMASAKPGFYIEFESVPGVDLKVDSLQSDSRGIEVTAVRDLVPDKPATKCQVATVFVPEGELRYFFQRFSQYANENTKTGKPKHQDLVERIAMLRLATLRALWTDASAPFPDDDALFWWEVWLRNTQPEAISRVRAFAAEVGLIVDKRSFSFHDRAVLLVYGTAQQLSGSLDVLCDLAEVRKARESAALLLDAEPVAQAEWGEELADRLEPPPGDCPAVCILDTGVTAGHPLLRPALDPKDAQSVDPEWEPHDESGHGTEMAGLATYGDLLEALASSDPVALRHRIESVKLLRGPKDHKPELYGAITAEAVSIAEITAPLRRRVFSMSVSSTDDREFGQPTSWSAAIDALAAGRSFDPATSGLVYLNDDAKRAPRLFVTCAGNVSDYPASDYLDRCDLEQVHDPGQAWNALTVGAYTDKAVITHPDWHGWSTVAPPGDLSPHSCTSVGFDRTWPNKPDVVFEGGNVAHDGSMPDLGVPDLCLLTTYHQPQDRWLERTSATSAATAQGARFAALVMAEYPDFWPETVRALVVHSARWTPAMSARFGAATTKRDRANLVRRYGFGAPGLERALHSAGDALTLVFQGIIHPFHDGKLREMHLHELPWPKETLEELGETAVRLRVTLSYFIDPNPSRRGWKKRHRYASHGLGFDVRLPTESTDGFLKRLNRLSLDETEAKPVVSGAADRWFLGELTRNKGSLHSDIWEGTAASIAASGVIGVYPVSGWWKDQPAWDRSSQGVRYALVVDIETDAAEVDLWTPVAVQVGLVASEIEVST